MARKYTKPVVMRQQFASFAELLAAAGGATLIPDSERSSRRGSAKFTRSDSYEHSESLAINGVPEIEARISRLSDTLESLAGECRDSMRLENDVYGDSVDVGLYLSGEQECMTRYEFETRETGNIFAIVVNGGAAGNIETEVIERRGGAVLALVDLLESAGYRCEVSVQFGTCNDNDDKLMTLINVKQAGESLDITRLCYSLAHPSMLRRTMFSLWETHPEARRFDAYAGGGYGSPADDTVPADLFVSFSDIYSFYNDESAKAWIQNALQTLGVKQNA